jgi:hypothetical protein
MITHRPGILLPVHSGHNKKLYPENSMRTALKLHGYSVGIPCVQPKNNVPYNFRGTALVLYL